MAGPRIILLDTNLLIGSLVDGTEEAAQLSRWMDADEQLATCSVVWHEFLSGPVDATGVDIMRATTAERILPFDAMIAASAVVAGARLATENRADFEVFVPFGLRLM